jgi:hypothetical protein
MERGKEMGWEQGLAIRWGTSKGFGGEKGSNIPEDKHEKRLDIKRIGSWMGRDRNSTK